MLYFHQTILLVALLSQFIHCALPEPQYNGRYVGELPGLGIGGVYPGLGEGMNYADIGNLVMTAATDANNVAELQGLLPAPAGASVYVSGNRDLIVAAIGAGTGNHGEQNIKIICEANGLDFAGGKMITWTFESGFKAACSMGGRDRDTRNCVALLTSYGIVDVITAVRAALHLKRRDALDTMAIEFHA